MRFFLAGRDRVTGSVSLVSETTFPSRQDALDSLGALLPVDGSFDGVDLFVADIERTTPVVVYKPAVVEPLPGMPVNEPMADAWESPAEATPAEADTADAAAPAPEAVEGPYADAVIAELEAAVAEPTVEPQAAEAESLPLMEALRRAADRMEADGIVAPEPVGESSEVAVAQWPWEAETVVAPEGETQAAPAPDAVSVSIADLAAALEADAGPLLTDEDMGIAGFTPEGIEEPAPQVDSMLAPPADDGFVPKPVIMGDYGATVPADMAVESEPAPAQVIAPVEEPEKAMEPAPVPEQVIEPEEETSDAPIDTVPSEPMGVAPSVEPVEAKESGTVIDVAAEAAADTGAEALPAEPEAATSSEPLDDLLAAIGEPSAPVAEPKAYAPGGLDMNAYTCDDCVYVGTCPKANEDSPATCGSFQWKSV